MPEVQGALRHGQRGDGLHGRAQGRARRDFILPDALPDARRARRRPGRRPGRRRRRRRPRLPARWGGSIGRRHSWRRDAGATRREVASLRRDLRREQTRAREADDRAARAEMAAERAERLEEERDALQTELARRESRENNALFEARTAKAKAKKASDELSSRLAEFQRAQSKLAYVENQRRLERDLNEGVSMAEAELLARFRREEPRSAVETLCRSLAGKNRQLARQIDEYGKLVRRVKQLERGWRGGAVGRPSRVRIRRGARRGAPLPRRGGERANHGRRERENRSRRPVGPFQATRVGRRRRRYMGRRRGERGRGRRAATAPSAEGRQRDGSFERRIFQRWIFQRAWAPSARPKRRRVSARSTTTDSVASRGGGVGRTSARGAARAARNCSTTY